MQSFNVASQGPFPVMIEDFPLRNGLFPESNVHPLSVTDLLQREDCCCYKREGLLKMKAYKHRHTSDKKRTNNQANIFKRSQLLVVKILSAIQFKSKRATQLPSRAAHSFLLQRLSSPEALCLLSASESHLREQPSFYCAVFSLFLFEPLYSVLLMFRAH